MTQNAGAATGIPQLGETKLHSSRAPERSVTLRTHACYHLLLLSYIIIISAAAGTTRRDEFLEVFARKERRVGALVHFFFPILRGRKSEDLPASAQKKRA